MTAVNACLLGLRFASCGAPPEDDASVVTEKDNLYFKTSRISGQRDIPVCWAVPPAVLSREDCIRTTAMHKFGHASRPISARWSGA
jgi:hypothetical protein